MKKYYHDEPDAQIDTGKNILRLYRGAGRLQVQMPKWTDANGEEKPGKTVALNLDALRETPGGVDFLQKMISDIA